MQILISHCRFFRKTRSLAKFIPFSFYQFSFFFFLDFHGNVTAFPCMCLATIYWIILRKCTLGCGVVKLHVNFTPTERVTAPVWGLSPQCKQALRTTVEVIENFAETVWCTYNFFPLRNLIVIQRSCCPRRRRCGLSSLIVSFRRLVALCFICLFVLFCFFTTHLRICFDIFSPVSMRNAFRYGKW